MKKAFGLIFVFSLLLMSTNALAFTWSLHDFNPGSYDFGYAITGNDYAHVWQSDFDTNPMYGSGRNGVIPFQTYDGAGGEGGKQKTSVIPEPSAIVLIGLGLMGLGMYRKFRA